MLSLALHDTRWRVRALSIIRGLADELLLTSLMTDPKAKSLFENPGSPEFRVLMLKNFGSKFSPEQCQMKVAFSSPPRPSQPLLLFEMNHEVLSSGTEFLSIYVPGAAHEGGNQDQGPLHQQVCDDD